MVKNKSTSKIVHAQYEELLQSGIFLQLFPQMVQETHIAETFKRRKNERHKSLTQAAFWFMLFNWIECNNYSITIGPDKRKILAAHGASWLVPSTSSTLQVSRLGF